jgi:hypothetical protein
MKGELRMAGNARGELRLAANVSKKRYGGFLGFSAVALNLENE